MMGGDHDCNSSSSHHYETGDDHSMHGGGKGGGSHKAGAGIPKTGRKGDPRMHAAVAARLANPGITLFEALKIGGFEYPDDEDSGYMDSELVTLGQRKNQLSRRLRMARKQNKGGERYDSPVSKQSTNPPKDSSGPPRETAMLPTSSNIGGNGNDSLQQQQQQQQQSQRLQFHQFMQQSIQNNIQQLCGSKRALEESAGAGAIGLASTFSDSGSNDNHALLQDEHLANNQRLAKFHPDFRPIVLPHNIGARSFTPSGGGSGLLSFNNNRGLPGHSNGQNGFNNNNMAFQGAARTNGSSAGGGIGDPLNPNPLQMGTDRFQTPASINAPSSFLQGLSQHHSIGSFSNNSTAALPTPSGVAIRSLSATAQSVGLTLEQLAVVLSNTSNLVEVLQGTSSNNCGNEKGKTSEVKEERQKELAVNLYLNECRGLYSKCMLLAGYTAEEAAEGSPKNLALTLAAWQKEGARLEQMLATSNRSYGFDPVEDPPLVVKASTGGSKQSAACSNGSGQGASGMCPCSVTDQRKRPPVLEAPAPAVQMTSPPRTQECQNNRSHGDHGHSHNHSHNHIPHEQDETNSDDDDDDNTPFECAFDGHRHIHRLEGKCGHKAILHQPADGLAHIDFLVGNKVECYQGVQPISQANSENNISVWPSKYKCEDVSCTNQQCAGDMIANHVHAENECPSVHNPKILEVQDIDFDGKEWNSEFSNGKMDGILLGLFKLGDTMTTGSRSETSQASNTLDV